MYECFHSCRMMSGSKEEQGRFNNSYLMISQLNTQAQMTNARESGTANSGLGLRGCSAKRKQAIVLDVMRAFLPSLVYYSHR